MERYLIHYSQIYGELMKKFISVLSVALVLCFFTTNESKAQLPDGAFGIGSSFSNG